MSSVVSRTITRSTSSKRVRTPLYVLHGRTCAYRSRLFRSPTLTERKPSPIGVVIGPLSATLFCRIDSSVSSGSGFPPCSAMTPSPAGRTSHSNSTPVASSTRRVASVSSGPVPSPGMRVTRCAMPRASVHVHSFGSIGRGIVRRHRSFDTEHVEGTAAVIPLPAVRRADVTVLRQEARSALVRAEWLAGESRWQDCVDVLARVRVPATSAPDLALRLLHCDAWARMYLGELEAA